MTAIELRFTTESPVPCDHCDETAVRRTISVNGRHVSYDTHVHAGHDEHWKALQRLRAFFERLFDLETQLHALPEESRKVPLTIIEDDNEEIIIGSLVFFSPDTLGSVIPQACERRTLITGEATLRAFGLTEIVKLTPTPLEGLTVEHLLELFKAAAEPALQRIHLKKKSGDY